MKIKTEVDRLAREGSRYESCDEGAFRRFARSEHTHIHVPIGPPAEGGPRKTNRVPALHLSWRQKITILDMNEEESRLLIEAGFNVNVGEDAPLVQVLEKKYRHRYLAYYNRGWVLSTADRGSNLAELTPCMHTLIPTITLSPSEEMILGVHDAWRTLKEDLRLHGVWPEFQVQQESIFKILGELTSEASSISKKGTEPVQTTHASTTMGRVSIGGGG